MFTKYKFLEHLTQPVKQKYAVTEPPQIRKPGGLE
jgi:hypothetical protein